MSRTRLPPGGAWFFTVPETGAYFENRMSFTQLTRDVSVHYKVNNLDEPEHLDLVIEGHICKNMPPGVCVGSTGVSRRLDFFSVLSATELLLKRGVVGSDSFYTTPGQALERAATCAKCPLNLRHMCTTCNGLRSTFKKLVSNRTTAYDSKLGVCEACGCGLAAKVHIAKKYLPKMPEDSLHKVPDYCWAKD